MTDVDRITDDKKFIGEGLIKKGKQKDEKLVRIILFIDLKFIIRNFLKIFMILSRIVEFIFFHIFKKTRHHQTNSNIFALQSRQQIHQLKN